jgi:SAM-dependent methyltransferase
MNYFSPKSAAERYLKGRLYFHPVIIGRVQEFLSMTEPLPRALDVGCGTGLSTRALKKIARNVVGVDASAEMLALAPSERGVSYCVARAECLPFGAERFDAITLSQVFHWLERDRFLSEAHRVLRPGGWLIVYDSYLPARTTKNAAFRDWHGGEYLRRYPPPPRAGLDFTAEVSRRQGFDLSGEQWLEHTISLSPEGLINYLLTQSNIIAAVEGGKEEIDQVREWLEASVETIFGESREADFLFSAPVWYLRRAA